MLSRVGIITALVAVLVTMSGGTASAVELTAVRHWTAPDHTRIVADLSGEASYSTRVLTDPDRVVVYIVGGTIGSASRRTEVEDGLIERVRLNQLDGGVQLVVDLGNAPVYNVFPLKPYANKPHRVVIDVFRESESAAPEPIVTPSGAGPKRVVIIDPGHGGEDPGTLGNGEIKEKDLVLDIARQLARELETRGRYEVRLTRDGDYFVRLAKRKEIANRRGGDIFISIHANSAPNRNACGTEVFFVSPRGASDQAARELADRENAADLVGGVSPDADTDVLSILVDLKMTDSVSKSSDLARMITRGLSCDGTSESVVKQAGFVVLKNLAMPSVLVEVGFLTNSADVARFKRPDYRSEYVERLADGIDAYFERYAPPALADDGTHRVAPGETLWSIARRYDVTVEELREANDLAEDATIRVDQVIRIEKS
ncbi:MAG: LysM peptidoglycan-binding domain-containing protein [Candidatus Eisenbacteria bacterium]|nr:LysM peptidoglycan-binding domain-containing protein [Candidatus Eisenbacteria bacterium]